MAPEFHCDSDLEPRFRRRISVASKVVRTLAYDPRTRAVEVVFRSGGATWVYFGMSPEGFTEWLNAESLGQHYVCTVRGRYQGVRMPAGAEVVA